jgi:hypothetical protein
MYYVWNKENIVMHNNSIKFRKLNMNICFASTEFKLPKFGILKSVFDNLKKKVSAYRIFKVYVGS